MLRKPATGSTASPALELTIGERAVRVTNPDRVYFSERGETKLDLVRYYLSVGDGIVNALRDRPCMLHRFPEGVDGEKVHQKRIPRGAPAWVETTQVYFPRYQRTADELCVTEIAQVIWAVQKSTVEFHPWNSRRAAVEHPDEWRIDLDPMPDCSFDTVRRAALAFAREVERRAPSQVTTAWWRKDRDPRAVFVDYNQNARDHTIASAYSVRGNPAGTVSTPITWDELPSVDPADWTIATVPERFARLGDLHAGMDEAVYDMTPLLEWADRDERDGAQSPPSGDAR